MTDLRDQLADFDPFTSYRITSAPRVGSLIRRLRHAAGLTLEQLGELTYVSKSGMHKRETESTTMSAGALIETLAALGFDLVAVPRQHTHLRRIA